MKHTVIQSSLLVLFTTTVFLTANANDLEPVRGVIKSSQEAVIGVEFSARVIDIPVKSGDSFSKGDTLIAFDCTVMQAENNAASASYQAAKMTHKNNLELQSYGAIGEIEVNVSAAQVNEAKAHAEAASAKTHDCNISAPYNGKVAELVVNEFEIPNVNQPLLKIVGSDELELRLIIPSNWLSWIDIDQEFSFSVDETSTTYQALVSQIGAEVDAVSRTVPIVARFVDQPHTILPGMSGNALFKNETNNDVAAVQ